MGGPGSGRKKGGGSKSSIKKPETFSISTTKMRATPIPKALKKKFAKEGGVNSPAYKAWVKKNWRS